MSRSKIAILFLTLIPVYLVPVLSVHICIGQEHHHGSCGGNMGHSKQEKQEFGGYEFEKAEHLQCFELNKQQQPCQYCKVATPSIQVAILVTLFGLPTSSEERSAKAVYQPPPNKEPPLSAYCIRPPPLV